MQAQPPALDHGLEHIALELLHHHDDRQHDQRVGQSVRHQGDENRDEAGEQRTHDRHERGDERQHGQRQHQRHTHDPEAETDENGVEQADVGLGAHELTQGVPATRRHGGNIGGEPAGQLTREPRQEPGAVLEHEEHEEDGQDCGDHTVDHRAHAGDDRGDHAADAVLDTGGRGVERAGDLVVTDVEGRPGGPLAQPLDAFDHAVGQFP